MKNMSKTPTKCDTVNFVPREITTPYKDSPGISKTVFTHVSKLHGLVSDWQKIRNNGVKICRAISSLKLHECKDDYYPHQLKPLTESLLDALDSLKNIVEGVSILCTQLQALAKLQRTNEPVIMTWSVTQISNSVDNILASLHQEIKLKKVIIENIAHCRDEKLIEVYVSSWEFETYLHSESYTYLFAEVGLTPIS